MQKLHNELIASPDDGSLIGSIHADTNDVIFSDTMISSLASLQQRPMTYHHKMMCGCAICNTSKYFKESLNAWRRKRLKKITKQIIHMEGNNMNDLKLTNNMPKKTFQKVKLVIHVAKMKQIMFFVHQLMMTVN